MDRAVDRDECKNDLSVLGACLYGIGVSAISGAGICAALCGFQPPALVREFGGAALSGELTMVKFRFAV